MKVVLAGASGLIGSALRERLLAEGHELTILVRRAPVGPEERQWDPQRRELDPAVLIGADAVICLSGAGVGDHRWSETYRQTIRSSRVEPVATLADAVAGVDSPPVLLCASAVGYYGDTGDRRVNETSPSGHSFLAEVCRDWEAAADPARAAGVRVVHLRTGLVIGPGGLLGRLRPLFALGVGGRLGNGRQYMPWISLTDEVSAIEFCWRNPAIEGPVNLVGPDPVTNSEFTQVLARVLHRPALLPVPKAALRVALGDFAEEALASQRVVPGVLDAHGFQFTHEDLEAALRSAL